MPVLSEKSTQMSNAVKGYWKQIDEIKEKYGISIQEAKRYYKENVKKKGKKPTDCYGNEIKPNFPIHSMKDGEDSESTTSISSISIEELLPVVKNYVRRCGNIEVAKMLLNFVDECKRM